MRQAVHNAFLRLVLVAAIVGALMEGAHSHDTWIGGKKVDPVTKALCCDQSDTAVVDDIVRTAEGGGVWFTDRPGVVIPLSRIQPSPDGHWWRSVWGGEIKCVFGPMSY